MSSLPIRDTVLFGAQEVCSPHLLHANRHWWGLYRKKSCFFPSYCHMLFHLPQQNVCLSEVHSSSLHFSLLVRSHVVVSSFISCLFLYCQDKHCCLFANFSQTAKSSQAVVYSVCFPRVSVEHAHEEVHPNGLRCAVAHQRHQWWNDSLLLGNCTWHFHFAALLLLWQEQHDCFPVFWRSPAAMLAVWCQLLPVCLKRCCGEEKTPYHVL